VAPGKVEEGGAHPNGAAPVKGAAMASVAMFLAMRWLQWSLLAAGGVLRWKGSDRNKGMTTNRRESKCGRSSPWRKKNGGDGFNPGGDDSSPVDGFGQEDKGGGGRSRSCAVLGEGKRRRNRKTR
jgi:hypothetical protein